MRPNVKLTSPELHEAMATAKYLAPPIDRLSAVAWTVALALTGAFWYWVGSIAM